MISLLSFYPTCKRLMKYLKQPVNTYVLSFSVSEWLKLYSAEIILVGALLSTLFAFLLRIELGIPKGVEYRKKVNKLMKELNITQGQAEKRLNNRIKWVKRIYYIFIFVGGVLIAIGTYFKVI